MSERTPPRKRGPQGRLAPGSDRIHEADGNTASDAPDKREAPARPDAGGSRFSRPATGYCNPPEATRFKPGQSGNPKGRPKGAGKLKGMASVAQASIAPSPGVDAIRRRLTAVPVRVREADGTRELHIIEALSKNLDKLAFAGGIQATRFAIERHEQTMRQLEAERREEAQWAAAYPAYYAERLRFYQRSGLPMPEWIARPEDIHFCPEKGLRIIGPWFEENLAPHLLLKQWRDAMLVRMIYDNVMFFGRPGQRVTITLAEFVVLLFDALMPKRWKLASADMQNREIRLLLQSRRQLRQTLQDAFDELGLTAPLDEPVAPVPDRWLRAFGFNPKEVRKRFTALHR